MKEKSPTPLAERLRARIKREGAISFHDWMEAALYDEREGYYCQQDFQRWGRLGDYRTSPERSPLFAATFARFFARLHEELDSPKLWTIWEGGAGAGHFARVALDTLAVDYPQVFSATRYTIDERSASSNSTALERLAPYAAHVEQHSLSETTDPQGAGIVFANELLDAFPVYRVVWRGRRLLEMCVGLDESAGFVWLEREPRTPHLAEYFERLDIRLLEGQVAEVNLDALGWLRRAAKLFTRGYLIIVDYGATARELYDPQLRPHGTLRAFRRHQFVDDVFDAPGEQDLTTTVDWTSVQRVCRESGLQIVSLERQDQFLLRSGLLEELQKRTDTAQADAASLSLTTTAREMILPGGMSASFQVLIAKKQ